MSRLESAEFELLLARLNASNVASALAFGVAEVPAERVEAAVERLERASDERLACVMSEVAQ
jgi:hypothetical protein